MKLNKDHEKVVKRSFEAQDKIKTHVINMIDFMGTISLMRICEYSIFINDERLIAAKEAGYHVGEGVYINGLERTERTTCRAVRLPKNPKRGNQASSTPETKAMKILNASSTEHMQQNITQEFIVTSSDSQHTKVINAFADQPAQSTRESHSLTECIDCLRCVREEISQNLRQSLR